MKKYFAILLIGCFALFLAACSCNSNTEEATDLPDLTNKLPQVHVKVHRYEQALFKLDLANLKAELKKIQPEYELFLAGDLEDPQNVKQLHDYLADEVIRGNYEECEKKFPNMDELERQLSISFSYYKYYFPEKNTPKVYTYVSGGDFSAPIKNADSALIIALDLYLGSSFPFYSKYGVPVYKSQWMDGKYIARDCMEELGLVVCSTENADPNFLDQMVSMGKLLYFLDVTMPTTPDSIKIKYTSGWLDWCNKNEGNIWEFFIEKKLLYSKDHNSFLKFFSDGPFTTTFGNDSPPRIALWVGWQIVRAYMRENKDLDIKGLLKETDSQKILKMSKYKPEK